MRTTIGKREFILSLIFNGINTGLWIYYIYYSIKNPHVFVFLTYITYHLNSLYLFTCLLCDIAFFCFNTTKLECFNDFNRNKYGIVVRTMSILVFFLYWSLKFTGGMRDLVDLLDTIKTIYLHLIITVFVIIDLFSANINRHRFSFIYIGFCTLYFILYFADCGVSTFVYNYPPYPFLEHISLKGISIYAGVFYLVLIFCYYCQVLMFDIKYKLIIRTGFDYYNNTLLPKGAEKVKDVESEESFDARINRESNTTNASDLV